MTATPARPDGAGAEERVATWAIRAVREGYSLVAQHPEARDFGSMARLNRHYDDGEPLEHRCCEHAAGAAAERGKVLVLLKRAKGLAQDADDVALMDAIDAALETGA